MTLGIEEINSYFLYVFTLSLGIAPDSKNESSIQTLPSVMYGIKRV